MKCSIFHQTAACRTPTRKVWRRRTKRPISTSENHYQSRSHHRCAPVTYSTARKCNWTRTFCEGNPTICKSSLSGWNDDFPGFLRHPRGWPVIARHLQIQIDDCFDAFNCLRSHCCAAQCFRSRVDSRAGGQDARYPLNGSSADSAISPLQWLRCHQGSKLYLDWWDIQRGWEGVAAIWIAQLAKSPSTPCSHHAKAAFPLFCSSESDSPCKWVPSRWRRTYSVIWTWTLSCSSWSILAFWLGLGLDAL